MPQGPIAVQVASVKPAIIGSTKLNITTPTTVKAAPGSVLVVNVVVKGTTDGTVNDCAVAGSASAANAIATLSSAATGTTVLYWPCSTGITVVPGTGQTITVSYE